jgi:hypothetical protein
MMRSISEEIWTTGVDSKLVRQMGIRAAADGLEAAYERAKELASKFEIHNFEHDEQRSYAWGRNKDTGVVHLFIVR